MLFEPKHKSRHGFQSMITVDQEQIAESLGDGISDSFSSAIDLIGYVNKNDTVLNGVSGVKECLVMTDPYSCY